MADEPKNESVPESTFLSHIVELRNRLFYALFGVGVMKEPVRTGGLAGSR